jgi:hypothetical protein
MKEYGRYSDGNTLQASVIEAASDTIWKAKFLPEPGIETPSHTL